MLPKILLAVRRIPIEVLRRGVRIAFFVAIPLALLAWWCQDGLPPETRIRPEVLAEPVQLPVELPVRRTVVGGVEYAIQPRYHYDISGLVVSLHHSDAWWDFVHEDWDDHINLMDLCVVWGANAASGDYRRIEFSNTQFECSASAGSREAWQDFRADQFSNNHLVTDSSGVARELRRIRIGDQVRLRGYLVNYTTFRDGQPLGTRISSDTRTDTGPGACEVIYVESVEALGPRSRGWHRLYLLSLVVLAGAALGWFLLPVQVFDQ